MAPKKDKEAIILAIDVGKNSLQQDFDGKTYFEKAIFCTSMILKRKLFSESKDEISIILFGSTQTVNNFSSQGNCFKNIELVTSLGVVTWDLLKYITSLSSTNVTQSDWLSTLIIATDILKNENDVKVFSGLQIVMFSNFNTDISFDKIDNITRCIQHLKINLTMIGKTCESLSLFPVLETFIIETKATAVVFEAVLPQLSFYNPKEVTPRAWKIPLNFGNAFSINVEGYKLIEESPKGPKWLLCKNNDTQDLLTHISKETKFYYDENEVQTQVDYNNIINGFRYGDTIVPVSDDDINAYSYKSGPRSFHVLGFTKINKIERSFLMDGGSYIFKPNEGHRVAFAAIFKAMHEREEIMIVRKVYINDCLPNIGAMFPRSKDDEIFFIYVNLPYAEDEHLFKLPSLTPFRPNDEQKIAVKNLINAMDLDDEDGECSMIEDTHSPEYQYVYYCIAQKAINEAELLKKTIPENVHNLLCPPKSIMEKAKEPINEIKKLFSFTPKIIEKNNFKKNNVASYHGHDEDVENKNQCLITECSPVEDFNKLMEEGLNSKIVCKTMQRLTLDLIQKSTNLQELKEKPASNLKALRQFYIFNKDVSSYNEWMYQVKDSVLLSGKEDIWSQFIDSGIGLITNQEVAHSSITQELSEEFMKHEFSEEFMNNEVLDEISAECISDFNDPTKEYF